MRYDPRRLKKEDILESDAMIFSGVDVIHYETPNSYQEGEILAIPHNLQRIPQSWSVEGDDAGYVEKASQWTRDKIFIKVRKNGKSVFTIKLY